MPCLQHLAVKDGLWWRVRPSEGELSIFDVCLQLPWAMVYEVQHCGFTAAWRERDDDGDWDAWELEDQDPERGVSWVA